MRLRRLDLTRYGRFTDYRIDFGEREAGRPDLHVVYGPNEAGKSTAFSAILDLLFGMGTRNDYAFLHGYATMRVGASLEFSDGARDFVRIKREQNTLLDGRDNPVADGTILKDLGGVDRKGYRAMFSLDDETLEEGGESILDSKGDLGQLLFSASAGLSDLSHGLDEVRAEADRFHRSARSGALADLKRQLDTFRTERAAIDTLVTDHARLLAARDKAATAYDEAIAARSRIETRRDEVQRQLHAVPRLAQLRRVEAGLAAFAGLPVPPPHWSEEIAGLGAEAIELGVKTAALDEEIAKLSARLEAIVVDAAALRMEERFAALSPLRARYETAENDLPGRRLTLREQDGAIALLLRRLDRDGDPEPRRLTLSSAVTGRLRRAIEARSGIEAGLKRASAELLAARRRLTEARETLTTAGGDGELSGPALGTLAAVAAAVRQEDFGARRRIAVRDLAEAKDDLADRLAGLFPWQGEVGELAGMRIPDAVTLTAWASDLAAARKVCSDRADQAERMTTERQRLDAERQALRTTADVATDREAAEIRSTRDEAWAAHREVLDAGSAARFEAALRCDDEVVARRFAQSADVASLRALDRALAVAEAGADDAAKQRAIAQRALEAVERRIAEAAAAVSPALAGFGLPEIEAWIARREAALRASTLVRTLGRDLAEAEADAEHARKRLEAALGAGGAEPRPEATVADLLAVATKRVDREVVLGALREVVADRQRDVERRQQEADTAAADERRWRREWAAICAGTWLGEGGAEPAVDAVTDVLGVLAELWPALDARDGLADRIAKMEDDRAAFRAEIVSIAAAMGAADPAADVATLARILDERIATARADRAARAGGERTLAEARETRRRLAMDLEIHGQRASVMMSAFGVATLAEVARKLADARERDRLDAEARDIARELCDLLRQPTLAEAEAALAFVDRAALDEELAELKRRFDDQDERCRECFAARSRAIDALDAIGGDATAAVIEERRRTVLAEIEAGALRYLKLRAGAVAAEQALRAYRDRHRSSMMARASDAFQTISRGVYSGLAAQPGEKGEILVALAAAGGSRKAEELSKGTRFQLYLALRVAGYHEFAAQRAPVPFVADDIMETFDDFRAEEAFRLFAGMAEVGQVIYLTHHRHLCAIARSVSCGVTLHELPLSTA